MFVCFLRKFKHWLSVCFLRKRKAHSVQVFFFINRKIQPRLWMHPNIPRESQNLISDLDATQNHAPPNPIPIPSPIRTSRRSSSSKSWVEVYLCLTSSTWRKERRASDLGFRWWKKAWVAHRSHRDPTQRSGAWTTSTSWASVTTTTTKVTHWNPTGFAWPTTCSDSVSPLPAGLSALPSSSTVVTPISLSTGPMGFTMRRSLRLLGFATSMISCLAFLTKQSNKIQWIFEFIFIFIRIYFEVIKIIL